MSLAVLAVIGAVLLAGLGRPEPADPVVSVQELRATPGGSHQVVAEVTNEGDRAAASVQVSATLRIGGEEQVGDQTVDFLGAGEQRTVVFVFADDPARGQLEVVVSGFAVP